MKHTGGRWDPQSPPVYFLASSVDMLARVAKTHDHILVAVNEISHDRHLAQIEDWCKAGLRVFIDSGVFHLANSHARANDIPMDEALALAPEEIDGFDELYAKYVGLIHRLGDQVWGYIEIDQGGRANKVRTRARLEAEGLRPIPVYHPFNDGWDYFDDLGKEYDRICFGNIVQADTTTRLRLLATAWERRRQYPSLWIHMLGMTPNEWLNAFPVNSCDSSSWLCPVRWTKAFRVRSALKTYTGMSDGFTYDMDEPADGLAGHSKATIFGAYDATMNMRMWHDLLADYTRLGCNYKLPRP